MRQDFLTERIDLPQASAGLDGVIFKALPNLSLHVAARVGNCQWFRDAYEQRSGYGSKVRQTACHFAFAHLHRR
jgi:hypothetical protein